MDVFTYFPELLVFKFSYTYFLHCLFDSVIINKSKSSTLIETIIENTILVFRLTFTANCRKLWKKATKQNTLGATCKNRKIIFRECQHLMWFMPHPGVWWEFFMAPNGTINSSKLNVYYAFGLRSILLSKAYWKCIKIESNNNSNLDILHSMVIVENIEPQSKIIINLSFDSSSFKFSWSTSKFNYYFSGSINLLVDTWVMVPKSAVEEIHKFCLEWRRLQRDW